MKAEKVFYGGPVLTVDKNNSVCEAVAVCGDKIIAVGTKENIWETVNEKTEVIDLAGRCLVPGLIDSHVHMGILGLNAMSIDCRSPKVSSIEQIKTLIREAAKVTPKGQWIRGWGYDHSKLDEKRHPNKWDLDEAAPDHPVMISRVCAHISTHNSKSLALAGINDESRPPAGGEFERVDGKVSGVMFENAHMYMTKIAIPSKDELVKALETADQMLVKEGITTLHDAGGYGPMQMGTLQEVESAGKINIRVNSMIFSFIDNLQFLDDYLKVGIHSGLGDAHYRLGPIKIMIDGSSSGPTAATTRPYENTVDNCGIMAMEIGTIDDIVKRAHDGGWQMTCHAVGDKAIGAMLDALEKAITANPRKDHRHRIEHCAMMTPEHMERIKKLDILPIPQPIFLYEFGDGYMRNYGKERAFKMFPCGWFLKEAVLIAGSSDCPVTFSNPLLNMHLAVNRETQTGQQINSEECISIMEALRMFTINGAYASFEENIKGSIEEGKLADLVVLSEDLTKTPRDKIRDVTADITMIGGKIVHRVK